MVVWLCGFGVIVEELFCDPDGLTQRRRGDTLLCGPNLNLYLSSACVFLSAELPKCGENRCFVPASRLFMLFVYLDLKVGDVTMKKIGEYALDIPAHVLSCSENLPSDNFHLTRKRCDNNVKQIWIAMSAVQSF